MSVVTYKPARESGIFSIGAIPAHWESVRFKNILSERGDRSLNGEEELLSVSSYTGVTPKSNSTNSGDFLSRAETLEGYKICHRYDLVMNIMLAWNRGLGVTSHDGIVSPAYCVFQLGPNLDPGFCDYALRSDEYTSYYRIHSSGVVDSRLRLYPDVFGSLNCALPPYDEQIAIAAFLDHETGKIDDLIAEQEQLISLLDEKRQAVISNAVTKGLNPDGEMNDSGIEWLGEVPAHWTIAPYKTLVDIQNGRDHKNIESERGYPVMGSGGAFAFATDFIYDGEAVLLGRKGTIDRPLYINGPFWCVDTMYWAKIRDGAHGRYAYYAALTIPFSYYSTNTALPSMTKTDLGNHKVPIPSLVEQKKIAEYLDSLTQRMSDLKREATEGIALLKERRSALISAAVTGKIDVRNHPAAVAALNKNKDN